MPKFKIQLVARVPVFTSLEVEAATQAEAFAKGEAFLTALAEGDQAAVTSAESLRWEYGLGPYTSVTGIVMDDRDYDEIEVQDVLLPRHPFQVVALNEPRGEGRGWEPCADSEPGALFYPERVNDPYDADMRDGRRTRAEAQADCDRLNAE